MHSFQAPHRNIYKNCVYNNSNCIAFEFIHPLYCFKILVFFMEWFIIPILLQIGYILYFEVATSTVF